MSHVIAIVGGGGRESALVEAYAKSSQVTGILVFPGNDLMQLLTDKPVTTFPDIRVTDIDKVVAQCRKSQVFLVDVAQDDAIAAGMVDALEAAGIIAIGPSKAAGRIEWDKAWSRELGESIGLHQPLVGVCHSLADAKKFLEDKPEQAWFVKAAGLAQGKGVLPALSNQEALERAEEMANFGNAGETFLLESWLVGEEFSSFAICDGEHFVMVGSAQDHKRVMDADQGANTGGMGAYTPPMIVDAALEAEVKTAVFAKTVAELKRRGIPYTGILYFGGMAVKTDTGVKPYVIEFNSRWGDPESEVILPGITTDYFEIVMAMHEGRIDKLAIETDGLVRVAVAGTSRGYPGSYSGVTGKRVYGIDETGAIPGVKIFGAGVKRENGLDYASGGRLFYVVGEGTSVIEARRKAYAGISVISVEGDNLHYRTDIGWRDVEKLRQSAH